MLKTALLLITFVWKTPVFGCFSTLSTEFSTSGKLFDSLQNVIFTLLLSKYNILCNFVCFYAVYECICRKGVFL